MPTIYDNIENKLIDGLKEYIINSNRVDFCVGYFNLRGWKGISDSIDNLVGEEVIENDVPKNRFCRLLVGMHKPPIEIIKESFEAEEDDLLMDNSEVIKQKKQLAKEFREQLTLGRPTNEDETALKKLSQQLKDGKVVVKLHLEYPLHAKLYLAYLKNNKITPKVGYLGSSNLTLAGLSKQGELNIDVLEQDASLKLANWFEERWNNRWCIDITKELIEVIDESWATTKLIPPYYIYLKIVYHLSSEARAGLSEYKLPNQFQKELLDFQQKAVLLAVHHLHKRKGVVIGDVVGLGKTMIATAIAKLFEDDFNSDTLILCPKNLEGMWEDYRLKYSLRAKVIAQSVAERELKNLKRFKLVIIDESHNLRNNEGSRYKAIKEYLEINDSYVVLLTATPYNKSYLDLSNQLKLFIPEQKDLGLSPEKYIESIGGNVQFNTKHSGTYIRSIKAFEFSNMTDDWRELMRLYLVRRTRSFIKNNYAKTEQETNRKYLTFFDGTKSYFPNRIPKKVLYSFNSDDENDIYAQLYSEEVVNNINGLNLPRYGLQPYVNPNPSIRPTETEQKILDNLNRAGKRLMGFCRTNLFKRLESSGYSFLISISRHILRNYIFIYALENNLDVPIGKKFTHNLDNYIEDEDIDNIENDKLDNDLYLNLIMDNDVYNQKAEFIYNDYKNPKLVKKFDWLKPQFFNHTLKNDLINDCNELIKILQIGRKWNPTIDKQLIALNDLINLKHKNEKVLVFTQFADTANYLKYELHNLNTKNLEVVTGDDDKPTAKAHRFSPFSNNKSNEIKKEDEIRVLIATDVLSEGQNLQDCNIIINYDLPWALIRLIQRTGRVDRIGQKAENIYCYNFLPEDGLEEIINLRKTLTNRIKENASVVGSDETFFDGDPINLTDLYNEKSGILDGEKDDDSEVDLSSLAYEIWQNAIKKQPELQKIIPNLANVIYSTKRNDEFEKREGVILYTKTNEDNDILTWINKNGQIITQSQYEILKSIKCDIDTQAIDRLEEHHLLVDEAIRHIKKDTFEFGASLGKTTSVKYQVYTRMKNYCEVNSGSMFVNNTLKQAIEDILAYPMRDFAKEVIGRQIKYGISDEELTTLITSLKEEDKLVIKNEDGKNKRVFNIICSLGLRN
jgi:superfamily II DNA or RNA helicase